MPTAEEILAFIERSASGQDSGEGSGAFEIQHRPTERDQMYPRSPWSLFTVASQHVYGESFREVLEKAMQEVEDFKRNGGKEGWFIK